eukprot:gene15183-17967_t
MLDLKNQTSQQTAMEAFFFGYQAFTAKADEMLERRGLSRVHQRIVFFIARYPALSVKELLELLGVSKQALNMPLRQLQEMHLVDSVASETDKRKRLLELTEEGRRFEQSLRREQVKLLQRAFAEAGETAVEGWLAKTLFALFVYKSIIRFVRVPDLLVNKTRWYLKALLPTHVRKSEAPTLDLSPTHNGWLERLFKLRLHGTTVKTELIAGLTTFITMAYIIFVNPNIMADAGIDHGAAFVATCIAAALGCLLMGLYANWPVGLAPGMGLNAFFTYTVVGTMGYNWETALGAVFISGVLFMILTLSRIREWLLNSIPVSLRHAMGAGVGLFLGVIGLKTAGIIVQSPATLTKLGSLHEPAPLLAAICFLLIAILSYHRVFGAILISIIAVTLAGWGLGLVEYHGILATPPSLAPTWMAMDVMGVFNVSMISVVFAFLFVHMFDTAGTLMGVAQRAGLVNADGKIENLSRALKADSASSVFGAMVGVPPVTSYVESAAGVAAGGRTGLTAVTVGVLFIAAMFFAPLAGMIPAYATAGALIYVAMLMMSGMAHINWDDATDSIPAIVTAIMMPLTFSVADGIALGFITYVALKAGTGKHKEISISLWVLCAIFIAKFAFL